MKFSENGRLAGQRINLCRGTEEAVNTVRKQSSAIVNIHTVIVVNDVHVDLQQYF